MTRLIWLAVLTLAMALGNGNSAFAQDALLQDLYGRGVHAFFARNFAEAHRDFTGAIDQGSRDPRCFYFRGLTYNRLGRPEEARADFRRGAELEASAGDQYYDVANALQRIQGSERIALEDTRRSAKLAVRQRNEDIKRVRYQDFTNSQPEVVRGGVPRKGTPPQVAKPSQLPPAPADGGDDLFEKPAGKPAPRTVAADPGDGDAMPAAEKPAPPAATGAEDPFGDDDKPKKPMKPAPAAVAGAEDPFGDDEKKAMPAKPAAPGAEDPFGDDDKKAMPAKPAAPGAEDPFGDDDKKAKPAKPAAPAAEDPFGDGDEKPKMKPEKPADPFADDPAEMKKDDGEMKKDDAEMKKDDGEMKKEEPKKDDKKNDDPFG